MNPVRPVVPGLDLALVNFAESQEEYMTLPAYVGPGYTKPVLSRWKLSWRERLKILCTGNLYLWVLTFGYPLQPLRPTVDKPQMDSEGRQGLWIWKET